MDTQRALLFVIALLVCLTVIITTWALPADARLRWLLALLAAGIGVVPRVPMPQLGDHDGDGQEHQVKVNPAP